MPSGWMVYRCEEHRTTQYVNAKAGADVALCCTEANLIDVATEREFALALKAIAAVSDA